MRFIQGYILVLISLQPGCSGSISLNASCTKTQSMNFVDSSLQPSIKDNIFLPSWNGLSGVMLGRGVSSDDLGVNSICKVYIETVPDQGKKGGVKTFLWSQENCQARGQRQLYLAFSSGYLNVDFKAKSSVIDSSAMNNSLSEKKDAVQHLLEHPWAISRLYKNSYGPPDYTEPHSENGFVSTVSFNPYGHIIEEIEILPSSSTVVNEFVELVMQNQLERREHLIPQKLEQAVKVFRDFFLEKNVIKRLLIDFSQRTAEGESGEKGYAFCSGDLTPQECTQDKVDITSSLKESLSPELWGEVKDYFHPQNQMIPNFNNFYNAQFIPLNDAIRSLFQSEKFLIRIPQKDLAGASLTERGFNDRHFSLVRVSEYGQHAQPLRISEPVGAMPHILLRDLQLQTSCSDPSFSIVAPGLFKKTYGIRSISVDSGVSLIGLGGLIPFAAKRPRSAVCIILLKEESGGTAITPLPEITLSDDDFIPESDLSDYVRQHKEEVQAQNQQAQNKDTPSCN